VIDHEIDARSGDQGSELLQQLDRREEEVRRAVVPLGLQGDQHEAVGRQREAVLGNWRPEDVATQALNARAVIGRDRDVRVEVEAFEVRLAPPARRDPGGARFPDLVVPQFERHYRRSA
jgi:hypothetical protein